MALKFSDYQIQATTPMKKGIVQMITNESVFMRRLSFVPVPEFTYSYNRQTTLGGIAFRGFNESYTDDTGVINPAIESLRIFGGSVKTDRQLAKGPTGIKVRANNIAMKMKKAGLFFDKYVINGDSAVDPKQFDGLRVRAAGNQVIDANGPLTRAILNKALDQTVGDNSQKIIVCNKATRRNFSDKVLLVAGGASRSDVAVQEESYNRAAVEVLDEDGDEAPILPFTEDSGAFTSAYVIRLGTDLDGEYVQGLVRDTNSDPVDHQDYGERSGFYEDLVEAVMGLAVFHPRAVTRIKRITDA